MSKKYQIYYLFMFREEISLFPSLSLLTNDAYTYFWVQTNYINSLYRGLRCVSLIFFGKLTSQSCYIGVDLYTFGTTGTQCTRPTQPNLLTRFLHNTYQALSAIYQNLSFHETLWQHYLEPLLIKFHPPPPPVSKRSWPGIDKMLETTDFWNILIQKFIKA